MRNLTRIVKRTPTPIQMPNPMNRYSMQVGTHMLHAQACKRSFNCSQLHCNRRKCPLDAYVLPRQRYGVVSLPQQALRFILLFEPSRNFDLLQHVCHLRLVGRTRANVQFSACTNTAKVSG